MRDTWDTPRLKNCEMTKFWMHGAGCHPRILQYLNYMHLFIRGHHEHFFSRQLLSEMILQLLNILNCWRHHLFIHKTGDLFLSLIVYVDQSKFEKDSLKIDYWSAWDSWGSWFIEVIHENLRFWLWVRLQSYVIGHKRFMIDSFQLPLFSGSEE